MTGDPRMDALTAVLDECKEILHQHTTEHADEWGAIQFDRGYHYALADVLRWIAEDPTLDRLHHEYECYLDSADNWPDPVELAAEVGGDGDE